MQIQQGHNITALILVKQYFADPVLIANTTQIQIQREIENLLDSAQVDGSPCKITQQEARKEVESQVYQFYCPQSFSRGGLYLNGSWLLWSVYDGLLWYMGDMSMSQFHTGWSHFSRLMVTKDYDGVSTKNYDYLID